MVCQCVKNCYTNKSKTLGLLPIKDGWINFCAKLCKIARVCQVDNGIPPATEAKLILACLQSCNAIDQATQIKAENDIDSEFEYTVVKDGKEINRFRTEKHAVDYSEQLYQDINPDKVERISVFHNQTLIYDSLDRDETGNMVWGYSPSSPL